MTKKADPFKNPLAEHTFQHKYAAVEGETWWERSIAIVEDVCGSRWGMTHPLMSKEERDQLVEYIHEMKFVPGGRYIYYAGRPAKFFNNCYLLRAESDTREEWSEVSYRAMSCLMTGGGIGVDYSRIRPGGRVLKRTGGIASGPIPLMYSINEIGRNVMQGGSRRSAIYASLNWQHEDVDDFLGVKNWNEIKVNGTNLAELKEADFNFPAPLDMTNISLNYDDDWLGLEDPASDEVFRRNVLQALSTGEPGFSFNFGDKENETLRNACVSGDTLILTDEGYKPIESCVGKKVNIWNGEEWSEVDPFETGVDYLYRVALSDGSYLDCTADHKWIIGGEFVETKDLLMGSKLDKFDMPVVKGFGPKHLGGAYSQGFYSGDGNRGYDFSWVYEPKYCCIKSLQGDIEDSVEGRKVWKHGPMFDKSWVPFGLHKDYRLQWLAGLLDADGTVTRDRHGSGFQIASVDHEFLDRLKLMLTTLGVRAKIVNAKQAGSYSMPNGKGGSANYNCKEVKRLLIGNYDAWHLMQLGLGIYLNRLEHDGGKPQRDARQFVKVESIEDLGRCEMTYCFTEPKASRGTFNGIITGQCTEVTSEDDSDVCNLGSVNVGAVESIEELSNVVHLASKFLVCGTMRAELPYDKVYEVRALNRRLGLGLMGLHEWLLKRGYPYEVVPELHQWLEVYKEQSESGANEHCDRFFLNRPVAYRAIAPTGTIGILAGTTTGIEPLFATAYKRRYLQNGTQWKYEIMVDSIADLLIREHGLDPEKIDTAQSLAAEPERRMEFQADVQDYVDMAISSTINLPSFDAISDPDVYVRDFANSLSTFAPRLRGFTCYPDGARGGQPITAVPYSEAKGHEGVVYEENDSCKGGVCGV